MASTPSIGRLLREDSMSDAEVAQIEMDSRRNSLMDTASLKSSKLLAQVRLSHLRKISQQFLPKAVSTGLPLFVTLYYQLKRHSKIKER